MTTTDTPTPDAQPGRVRVWFERAAEDGKTLPEAITDPQTPIQIWAHARKGAWTTHGEDSPGRLFATGWAAAAVGVAVVCDSVKWSVQRPTRFFTVAVFTVLIGTAVAQVPVLGAIVPDLFNITAW